MNTIDNFSLKLNAMSVPVKVLSVIIAFLTPLTSIIHVILFLLFIDMFTSIYYQISQAIPTNSPFTTNVKLAFRIIESSKMRKTIEKMMFYVLALIVFYMFDLYILHISPETATSISAVTVTNISAALIAMVELTSITSNISKITGNPVFNRIAKIITKNINQKYNIDKED
ncbi:MAG: phage holin family protein [Candidatus Delongbacteria bacterium]|nr:phage holin family protein [Candidatus Delongbacteria bacterium]